MDSVDSTLRRAADLALRTVEGCDHAAVTLLDGATRRHAATDGLTRIYGVPGRTASAIRRFGMGIVQRVGPLKSQFMAEARGESGELPLLLRGLTI